jgi:hypothetical protein
VPGPKGTGVLSRGHISAPGMARLPSPESTGLLSRWLRTARGLEKDVTAIGSFMIALAALMTAIGA